MATYAELIRRKKELDVQIAAARRAEASVELSKIRTTVAEFGFTAKDIFGTGRYIKGRTPPQFRNPLTGQTWSGRGRMPAWMSGKDREQYRIRDELTWTDNHQLSRFDSCVDDIAPRIY